MSEGLKGFRAEGLKGWWVVVVVMVVVVVSGGGAEGRGWV